MSEDNKTEIVQEDAPETQPEPQTANVNPYQVIIDQQQEQINALIEQSNALTKQITNLVQNGAQLANTAPQTALEQPQTLDSFNPKSLSETDSFLSMEDLAKEIGKR